MNLLDLFQLIRNRERIPLEPVVNLAADVMARAALPRELKESKEPYDEQNPCDDPACGFCRPEAKTRNDFGGKIQPIEDAEVIT